MNLQDALFLVPLISNLAAFLAAALFARLHRTGPAAGVITGVLALPGGAPGAVLALFLFDRKARKETMLLRVFLACLLAAQLALLCFFLSFHGQPLHLNPFAFFAACPALVWVLALLNLVSFAVFGLDKRAAKTGRRRVRITVLLALCYAGGAVGGLLAMAVFRHKTQKIYFTAGLPLMLVMQAVVLFTAMNL